MTTTSTVPPRRAPSWFPYFLKTICYTVDYMGLIPGLNIFAAWIEVFLGIFFALTLPLFAVLYWLYGSDESPASLDLQEWFWGAWFGRKAISLKEQKEPSDPVMYRIRDRRDVLWYSCFIPLYCFGNALSNVYYLKYVFYPLIMASEKQIRMVSFDYFTFSAFSIIAGIPWQVEDLDVQ